MTAEERLNRLERNNRRLTVATVLTGAAAVLIVTAGMAEPKTPPEKIRAGQFELADADGNVHAGLAMTKDGPQIYLSDEDGKVRATLTATKGSSGLCLFDENGKARASLEFNSNGPGLLMFDENGKLRHWANGNANPYYPSTEEN